MNDETMDCREAIRLLAEYLDGELDTTESVRVERHLDRCRDCYSRSEFERRLKDQLSELGRRAVDPAFEKRIRNLIHPTQGGPEWS